MKWLFVLLVGMLSLHANAQETNAASPTAQRSPQALFLAEGRISVRYAQVGKEGQDQQLSGLFSWQQDADSTRILLSSPTSQALAEIRVTANLASLTQIGQSPRSAPNVDQLTQEMLGWPLPVAGMRDWLQGFALDETGTRVIASTTRDSITTSDGWRLRYASWHDASHPKRIDLERHIDAQGGDVYIRIVLDPAP